MVMKKIEQSYWIETSWIETSPLKEVAVIGFINKLHKLNETKLSRVDVDILANRIGYTNAGFYEGALLDLRQGVYPTKEEVLRAHPNDTLVLRWLSGDHCVDVE